jgi:hypothetical protein
VRDTRYCNGVTETTFSKSGMKNCCHALVDATLFYIQKGAPYTEAGDLHDLTKLQHASSSSPRLANPERVSLEMDEVHT